MCVAIPLISVSITIVIIVLAALWSIRSDKKFRKMKYASKIKRDDEGRWVMLVYVRCGIWEDYDWCWCVTYYKVQDDGSWVFNSSTDFGHKPTIFNNESEAIKAQEKWKEYVEKFNLD